MNHEAISIDFEIQKLNSPIKAIPPTPPFFYDQLRFTDFLEEEVDFVDALTYSASPFFPVFIRRLILTTSSSPLIAVKSILRVSENHAKLYICYRNDKPIAAFIGSMNAVGSTSFELMYKLPPRQLRPTTEYFNALWKNNQSIKQ